MIDQTLNRRPLEQTAPDVDFVVGAVVFRPDGRVFVQKRTLTRALFPGCWDVVGGHVERGETLAQALEREVREETGWTIRRIGPLVQEYRWEAIEKGSVRTKIEFDFVVEIAGDYDSPRLERDKHSEFAWIGSDRIELVEQDRDPSDTFIADLIRSAFEKRAENPC